MKLKSIIKSAMITIAVLAALLFFAAGCASRPAIDSQLNQLSAMAEYHDAQRKALAASALLESATERAEEAQARKLEADAAFELAKRALEESLK